MMDAQPVRYRVFIVGPDALTGKTVPRIITFGISQVGVDARSYLFDATVLPENLDCCIALQHIGSIVVEADEDTALRKDGWQTRIISAALRGAFPKPGLR
jgi:hypothetical protein